MNFEGPKQDKGSVSDRDHAQRPIANKPIEEKGSTSEATDSDPSVPGEKGEPQAIAERGALSTNERVGCDEPWWMSRADAISKWATTFALFAAGVWAVFHFYVHREGQSSLFIEITSTSTPYGNGTHLVTFDVSFVNKGSVRIEAQPKVGPPCPAYSDADEIILYGGDLLLRRIPDGLKTGANVAWFQEKDEKSPKIGDLEADLLRIFRNDKNETDFWIEPGEAYHLTHSFVLEPGNYMVMITFVGDRSPEEFWRRIAIVAVPLPSTRATVHEAMQQ